VLLMRISFSIGALSLAVCASAISPVIRSDPTKEIRPGVGFCSARPGEGCQGPLMRWTTREDVPAWAVGCNVGGDRFCGWCTQTGRTTMYSAGVEPKPADCEPR
jgi:hypothetical protein